MTKEAVLYVAGNGLGCIEDIPRRSLQLLKDCDMLVFEEARQARQCLKAAGVQREYWLFNEHGGAQTLAEVEKAFSLGKKVCLMSDQGMPHVADPGDDLIQLAYSMGVTLRAVPGPSSITVAAAMCPFLKGAFYYAGFLPQKTEKRLDALTQLKDSPVPVIILEAPYRRKNLLQACLEIIGENRMAFLAVEIGSSEREGYYHGNLDQLLRQSQDLGKDFNFVLILDGSSL